MKVHGALIVVCGMLCVALVACGTTTPATQSGTPSPTPCATLARPIVSSTSAAYPAGVTTPSATQPSLSPQQLLTQEAIVAQKNQPVTTVPGGQPNSSSLPPCPTPTPVK